MKKYLVLIMAAVVTLCGCTQQKVYSVVEGSYWLRSSIVGEVGAIDETCIYTVSYQSPETEIELSAEIDGTFTTRLYNGTYNGTACYIFQTSLAVTGNYFVGEDKYPVNDTATSVCYFLGTSAMLSPLHSEKSVNSITPVKINEEYSFPRIAYSSVIEYDREKNEATVSVTPGEGTTEGYAVAAVDGRKYEKYKARTYFDSDSMIFVPRAAKFESGYAASFTSIDALGGKVHNMTLAVDSETSPQLIVNDYSDGISIYESKTFTVHNVTIKISDTFAGSPIKLAYAAPSTSEDNRNRLIQMKTELPYSLGNLVYTLKQVKTA